MQYRFSFALETVSKVPGDFVLPPDLGTLHAGVFLPADDADWRGRGDTLREFCFSAAARS